MFSQSPLRSFSEAILEKSSTVFTAAEKQNFPFILADNFQMRKLIARYKSIEANLYENRTYSIYINILETWEETANIQLSGHQPNSFGQSVTQKCQGNLFEP